MTTPAPAITTTIITMIITSQFFLELLQVGWFTNSEL